MKIDRYLPALREYKQRQVTKRETPGARILASLFPTRGTGWPGGWSQDRLEQSLHNRNWIYVCNDLICSMVASIFPNIAYVVDHPKPGLTVKAGARGLMNLRCLRGGDVFSDHNSRGFSGSPLVGDRYSYRD